MKHFGCETGRASGLGEAVGQHTHRAEDLRTQFAHVKKLFEDGHFDDARDKADKLQQHVFRSCSIESQTTAATPKYSIVVLGLEASGAFSNLLRMLARHAERNDYEIIIVGNGTNVLRDAIAEVSGSFVHVGIPFNFGCSGGRNIGAMAARGTHVLFLDDDGVINEDTVEELVRVTTTHDALAVRGRIEPKTADGIAGGNYDRGDMLIPCPPTTEGISIWKKQEFLDFGGFDPLLAGHEGFLLCARMLRFFGPERFLYAPDALLLHDYAGSADGATQKMERYAQNDAYIAHHGVDKAAVQRIFHAYRSPCWQLHACKTALAFERPDTGNEAPRVSILTTARDGAEFVGDYCRMLELQTHQDFEVIFVDDGSTDGTTERLKSDWPIDENRLTIVRTAGTGRAAALNLAVAHARSDICLIADIDDISLSDRFEKTAAYFMDHPGSGCVSLRLFSNDPKRGPARPLPLGPVSLKARCLFGMPASFPAFAFRKSAFPLLFDEELEAGVDCDWLHRNFVHGAADGHFLPVLGTYYHLHDGQISNHKRDLQRQVALDRTAAFHAHYLGPLDEERIASAHMLSGWSKLQRHADLEAVKTHESLLIDAMASVEPGLAPEAATLLAMRVRELEVDILRKVANESRRASKRVSTSKPVATTPAKSKIRTEPEPSQPDKGATGKPSKPEKKPTGVRIKKEMGRWTRKAAQRLSGN